MMFQGLLRYQSYHRAGDWLAELPSHWGWNPARTLFRERKESGFDDEALLSVTIGRGVISQADLLSSSSKKDSSNVDKSKYKLVAPDDLVYNKMRAWQGAAGLSRYRGIVSPAYVVMTPRGGEPAFFHHLVRTPLFAKEAERWSYGITSDQWSLRPEHFKMIRFPVPPAEEQAAIVKYLAHANARIDKAISAKRRLIALLEEQVAAQVEALLGESAALADIMLGRAIWKIEQGTSPSPAEGELADDQWAVLSLSAVNRGTFRATALKPVETTFSVPEGMELRDGDLLMTRSNTRERVGDVAIVRGVRPRTFMPDLIYRLVLREQLLSPEYASLALRSRRLRNQIEVLARGSSDTMPKLAQRHIKSLRLPLPDIDIQAGLVAKVEGLSRPARTAVDRLINEMALLAEFHSRLVADVVTGQVDVREIAASLPDIDLSASWRSSDGIAEADLADVEELMDIVEA